MKIGIYGAGEPGPIADQNIPFIAVDGGYQALIEQGIQPVYMIGDFDSWTSRPDLQAEKVQVLPSHKDYTETEMAI